ncbi:MAG: hypothetical protein MR510_12970 [Clostridium sp.]|uniref:hypothetical protein n=1 Tax=Clostridium sp. TaxID=1506 RepID=UPI002A8038EA|nr:hypothetical protein [Clostridium sp.]MCI6693371.1 hypothetical protein [Clostridium sp.]MDY4253506.1 hypothetical protein [Clostridium sp.]MDY6228151.1 hypothetical protein [Clostridium sp.]
MIEVLKDSLELEVIKMISSYDKNVEKNFKITEDISFHDDIWDFNKFNLAKRDRETYSYNFMNIQECFRLGTKMLVLNKRFIERCKFGTVHKVYSNIRNISNYMLRNNINDLNLITLKVLKEYFEEECKDLQNHTKTLRAKDFKDLLYIYSKYYKIDFEHLIKYLDIFIDNNPEKKGSTAVNKYIPDSLLNQIVSLAIIDLNNNKLSIRDRMIAGFIVLIAETGMRIEEVSMLESNMLKSISDGKKEAYYLNFYTFKITQFGEEKKLTSTFLSELALNSYNKLCELRDEIINGLNEMSMLRLIIQTKEDKILKGRVNISELREIVNSYTVDEMNEIKKEINRFLFISAETGRQKRGGKLLRVNMEEFYIRHENDFDISCLSSSEREEVRKLSITSKSKYLKYFNKEERRKYSYEEIKNKKYIYVNPHQFRVTVCTKLFLKGVHLDYIVKHLNHLSEDMTMYYNKSVDFEKKLEDTVDIFIENLNEQGIIETQIEKVKNDVFKEELKSSKFKQDIENINNFIRKNKFNINVDIKKIMKLLKKTNSPLVENEFGVCIVSVVQRLCNRRKYFSSLNDNYHIGIQLKTYKNINYSYERFKNKLEIINHNEEVAKNNPELKNEYEREVKALKYFINKRLKLELELLKNDIEAKGITEVKKEYPDLDMIIDNFEKIMGEVEEWME